MIATKCGEEFENGESRFDFSGKHTRMSIERSLSRLGTDYLDIVLIHSDGDDAAILNDSDCVETLRACQAEGKIRAIGMSTKTTAGGIKAASIMDVVMITYNLEKQDQEVLDFCFKARQGGIGEKRVNERSCRFSRGKHEAAVCKTQH